MSSLILRASFIINCILVWSVNAEAQTLKGGKCYAKVQVPSIYEEVEESY